MKMSSWAKINGVLAVVLLLAVGQIAWAKGPQCESEYSGKIVELDHRNGMVIEVYPDGGGTPYKVLIFGIQLNYLENWVDVERLVGREVFIEAHNCPLKGRLLACSLEIENGIDPENDPIVIDLRPRKPKKIDYEVESGKWNSE